MYTITKYSKWKKKSFLNWNSGNKVCNGSYEEKTVIVTFFKLEKKTFTEAHLNAGKIV